MTTEDIKTAVRSGNTALGIEFGSTRIKAVLIGPDYAPIAAGTSDWENQLVDKIWTYSLEDIWAGLRECYAALKRDVMEQYALPLERVGCLGVSAMMHGYLCFDQNGELLVPFRTWRNTMTGASSDELTKLFGFHIPQRWSIAHLYQAILNGEEHVSRIAALSTLAGYIHWRLTGRRVAGVGEASGMFPIDSASGQYNDRMLAQFDELTANYNLPWKLRELLPEVLPAGADAGALTEEGSRLLDPSGKLEAGIPFCPPEGDAGTGMAATNSVARRSGNISAGTSIFAMVVLEKELNRAYPEIDLVTTPSGDPVAMVHCNNCTSDLNAWVGVFGEFAKALGVEADAGTLFGTLYNKALEGDPDCGGLLAYNYLSGEHNMGFDEGRPLFVRSPDSKFSLANFMRVHLFTALGAMRIGMDILLGREGAQLDKIYGQGGLFRTEGVGQRMMAAALNTPVSVMTTAGEGGPWGMALLASYRMRRQPGETLERYLADRVFTGSQGSTVYPEAKDAEGFAEFMKRYIKGLAIERAAVEYL